MNRESQREQLLSLLRRAHGDWVPLPEILDLRISQYSARICELRKLGHQIENKTARENGETKSWFRLVETPQRPLQTRLPAKPDEQLESKPAVQSDLFPEARR
jgi:hypothetical protein